MSILPALGRLRQKDFKFEGNLGYMSPCLIKDCAAWRKKKKMILKEVRKTEPQKLANKEELSLRIESPLL